MIAATYFGEITELGSRAVWYSDEESDADDDNIEDIESQSLAKLKSPIGFASHETIRTNLSVHFKRLKPNPSGPITSCLVSLSSSPQYKSLKINDSSLTMIGTFGNLGKVFVCPPVDRTRCFSSDDCSLWILFDSSDPILNGQEVAYFVEVLREELYTKLGVQPNSSLIVLSQQFSNTEHLEYLVNFQSPSMSLPFIGRPMLPPALIKNQLESSLFEQSTLALKQAYVVCLPDPKNFWFDKAGSWPAVANQVIEHKLNDDNLEKTLIFT